MGEQVIRVANIIEEGRYGGPQARICGVAERLKNKNIETTIICPLKDSERFSFEAAKRNIEIYRIGLHRLSRSKRDILYYILTLPREIYVLHRILKQENIDIIHCNSPRQFKGVIAGRLSGKKVIWHLNDTFSPLIILNLFYLTSCMANYFITTGERVREYYLNRFPLNRKLVKIIQAPVNTSYYNPDLIEPDKRLATGPFPKIVSVGNVNPAKGFEYFVQAAQYMSKHKSNPRFWIVGPLFGSQKSYHNRLQAMIDIWKLNNIEFYGTTDNVRAILKSADIFVCSSTHESGPISLFEAMAMGKAIVSTDVGDVKRFIRDGENGFIVPTKDPKALADKIEILLNNAELRKSFGAKARETAVEHLDISVCVQKHAEFYRQVLDG